MGHAFAFGDDTLAGLGGVSAMLDGGDGDGLGEGIGVVAVACLVEGGDEVAVAYPVAESQARERIALAERAEEQDVIEPGLRMEQ